MCISLGSNHPFRVFQLNCLAECFFEFGSDNYHESYQSFDNRFVIFIWVLYVFFRFQYIIKEIFHHKADLICLQEIDVIHWPRFSEVCSYLLIYVSVS